MLGDAVLAIDQGTSATKAVVTGLDGSVLALAECPIDVAARPDGSVEFDPIEMWNSDRDPRFFKTSPKNLGFARSGAGREAVQIDDSHERFSSSTIVQSCGGSLGMARIGKFEGDN